MVYVTVLYVTLLDCFNLDVAYWTVSINVTLPADSCRATQSAAGEYTVVISTVENRHQAWECFDSTAETQTSHTAVIFLLSAAGRVQKYTGIPSFRLI